MFSFGNTASQNPADEASAPAASPSMTLSDRVRAVVEQLRVPVFGYAMRKTRDSGRIGDISRETVLRLFRYLKEERPVDTAKAWLFTAAADREKPSLPRERPERLRLVALNLAALRRKSPRLCALPDGSAESFNQRLTGYSGWPPQRITQTSSHISGVSLSRNCITSGLAVLLIFSFLLTGCAGANSAGPAIEFSKIPPAAQGGRERVDTIAGRVRNARPGQKIVIYAHSGQWWVQPSPDRPLIPIRADSTWSTETHLGFEYAALLVGPDYHPLSTLDVAPMQGGSVALATIVKGTGTPQFAPVGSLKFSGYDWGVRKIESDKGGMSNLYDSENAWTDASGELHLQIRKKADRWSCAEIFLNRSLGYGTYSLTVRDTSHLEPAAVFSMFTFDEWASDQSFREMDVEIRGRGDAANKNNAQYQIQPIYIPGNLFAFAAPAGPWTFVLHWESGHATFKTFRGTSAGAGAQLVSEHEFTSGVPAAGKEVPRLIFYVAANDKNPMQQPSEVVVEKFGYLP